MTDASFSPLLDLEERIGTIRKGEVEKYLSKIKDAAKKGAKAGVTYGLTQLGVPNAGGLFALVSAYSSKQHAKRLGELKIDPAYPCDCGLCEDAIDFAIAQKAAKAKSKVVDAAAGFVPEGGKIKAGVKALLERRKKKPEWEETSGYWAVVLWGSAKPANADIAEEDDSGRFKLLSMQQDVGNCLKAFATIAELMGNYREQKSMERADALTLHQFGIDMIKAKLQPE